MHTRTLFAAITILLLLFISAPLAIVQADTPPPGVDTAQRDDVVPEDDEGGASGAVDDGSGALLPDVDNAQRDDVVPEDDGGGASGAVDEGTEGRLPDVDTAQRDDVVPEDDGGGASGAVDDGSGVLLPDVDNAQRDDVIREDDGGGASGAVDEGTEGRLPDVDNAQRDDVVPEDDGGGASGAVDGGVTPPAGVDTAQRDDVVPEDDGGGATGAADDGGVTPPAGVDTAQRDDVVPEDDGSTTERVPTAPAPTGLRVTSDTDDSVSLSWNAVTDAGAYKVEYRRSGSISWLHAGYVYSNTSDTVDGLDCNTSYYFQVRARGDGSPYSYTYGNPSSSVSETTDACVAPAPTGLTVTSDTDDSVSLSWNTVTDAGAYKVEYRRSGSISWLHAGYVWSGSSDTVDGLDCNTSYYFQVRARGDGSPYSYTYGNPSSSVSETTDACVAPAPTGLTVTSDTDDSVSLSWNAVTDAGAYKVEYRRSSSISWLHAGYVWSGSSDTVDGLDCNTSYYFQVRARGDGSPYSYTYGNPSFSVSETTDACPVPVAPAPTGLTVTSDTDDSVSLSWNAVTDAAVYQVEYRRSSSISWLHAGYVWSGSSDTVDGLDCNTSYDFRVRARGDGSPYSTTYGNPSSSVSETTGACVAPDAAVYQVEYSKHVRYGGRVGLQRDSRYGLSLHNIWQPFIQRVGDDRSGSGCARADTDDSVSLSWNTVTDAVSLSWNACRRRPNVWPAAGNGSDTGSGRIPKEQFHQLAPRRLRVLKHVRYGGRVGLRHELRLSGPRPWRWQPIPHNLRQPFIQRVRDDLDVFKQPTGLQPCILQLFGQRRWR